MSRAGVYLAANCATTRPTTTSATARRAAARRCASRSGAEANVIKIATTGGVNSRIGAGLGAQMFDDEARALIETAHLYGLKVAVHAHGINMALRMGADSIEHGTIFDDETIRLFRQSGACYVPTRRP